MFLIEASTSLRDRRTAAAGQGALGAAAVQDFIHKKNLEHYRKLLAGTPNEADRALLVRLLTEEEAKEPPWKITANDE